MVVSRRRFMKQGTLLVLTAGASLSGAKSTFGRQSLARHSEQELPVSNRKSLASSIFTKANFAAHLNTVFRIYPDASKAIKSTLISVSDMGPVPDQPVSGRECFVLRFRGSRPLPQNRYRIEHEFLGKFELMLVPGGSDRKGSYYQAVINRLNG